MVISHFYPALGGAEEQARRLAAMLRMRGVDVFVLTRRLGHLPPFEVIDGIPVYRCIRTVNIPLLFGMLYVLTVAWFLYRKRHEYALIHCHMLQEYQTFVAVVFKFLFKKKVIAKMSSSGLTSDLKVMKGSIAGRVSLRLLRRMDRIISICSKSTQELLDVGIAPQRLESISNGVDTQKFKRCAIQKQRRTIITYIGRLDQYKGVDCLIEAFGMISTKRSDFVLNIIGNGPAYSHLRRMADALQKRGRVVFKGWRDDILYELVHSDIFVLPSHSEGMPNVLLEAMSCGLPIIATAVGGAVDIVHHRYNGLLVPPGDARALACAIMELVENDSLAGKLGKAARATVIEGYDLSCIAERYLMLYRQLLAS